MKKAGVYVLIFESLHPFMAPSPVSHLELNVLMGSAPSDSPMIALMLIPPSTNSVMSDDAITAMMQGTYQLQTVNLRLNPEGTGAATTTSGSSTKAVEDGPAVCEDPGRGIKRVRDADGDLPEGGMKLQKAESASVPAILNPSTAPKADAPTTPQAGPSKASQTGPSITPQVGPTVTITDTLMMIADT